MGGNVLLQSKHQGLDAHLAGMQRLFPGYQLTELLAAKVDLERGRHAHALSRALGLLSSEYGQLEIYDLMTKALAGLGLSALSSDVEAFWDAHNPGSALVKTLLAQQHIAKSVELRGGGLAASVPASSWPKIDSHVKAAGDLLARAHAQESRNLDVIALAMGNCLYARERPREQMEAWYRTGIAVDPHDMRLAEARLTFLLPQWYGSEPELFAFARGFARTAPPDRGGGLLVTEAHRQTACNRGRAEGDGDCKRYYRHPAVWPEIRTLCEPAFQHQLSFQNEIRMITAYAAAATWSAHDQEYVKVNPKLKLYWSRAYWRTSDELLQDALKAYDRVEGKAR